MLGRDSSGEASGTGGSKQGDGMNLYETLQVDPSADTNAIKRAFRARSRATHPDRGGDPVEFQAVHFAWKILGDPERRARYDQTGQADEIKPDNTHVVVMGAMSNYLALAIQE